MTPDNTPADRLETDERTALASEPAALAVAADMTRQGAGQPPDPSPGFRAEAVRRAAELDNPVTVPATDKRGWLARHRLVSTAGSVAAGLLLLVFVALPAYRHRDRGQEVVGGDTLPPVVWTGFKRGEPAEKPIPTTNVGFDLQAVDRSAVMGDERDLSLAQKKFGDWVIRMGVLDPKVTVNGQTKSLKARPDDPLMKEEETGWELSGISFVTKTRRTVALARQVGETLFGVQNPDIYPGMVFDGKEYLTTGSVVPARAMSDRGTFARQRLTIIGPTLDVSGAVDQKQAGPGAVAARKQNLFDAGGARTLVTFDPASRTDYERARKEMLPAVGDGSFYSIEVDTARCKEEFEFKAGLKVSGGFGEVVTKFGMEEREEHGMVFARGVEVAYTVAVDDRERAARWVSPTANVDDLVKGDSALMYCDALVYGRAWMVVATSTLTSKEMQAVFNGTINTLWATLEPSLLVKKKAELAATSVKVFNLGGAPDIESFKFDLTKFDTIPDQIRSLQKPALSRDKAMPIAYRTKWLATDKETGWVGVVPMRTFTQTTEPVRFDLTLRHYKVREEFGGTLVFGGGGKLNIGTRMVNPDGTLGIYDTNRRFYRNLEAKKDYLDINHPLIVGAGVPAAEFTVLVRQAELGGGIDTWEKFAERVGDGFGEQQVQVNVPELLELPDKSKEYVLKFPGDGVKDPNWVHVVARLRTPPVPPLPASKPLPDVGTKTERKSVPDDANKKN